jgi:hypothetical protein
LLRHGAAVRQPASLAGFGSEWDKLYHPFLNIMYKDKRFVMKKGQNLEGTKYLRILAFIIFSCSGKLTAEI